MRGEKKAQNKVGPSRDMCRAAATKHVSLSGESRKGKGKESMSGKNQTKEQGKRGKKINTSPVLATSRRKKKSEAGKGHP